MIPAFIIHSSKCIERQPIVKELQEKTGATVLEASLLENRREGCSTSHIRVAETAKKLYPSQPYLVFEDDCILNDNWKESLTLSSDVVYLGYNNSSKTTIFGTHALLISPKARDIILNHTRQHALDVYDKWAFDWILSFLCHSYNLSVQLPSFDKRNLYCFQKPNLISQITGKPRT